MPEAPPCTSKVSPGFSAADSNTLAQTVNTVSGKAAASVIESLSGTGSTAPSWAIA